MRFARRNGGSARPSSADLPSKVKSHYEGLPSLSQAFSIRHTSVTTGLSRIREPSSSSQTFHSSCADSISMLAFALGMVSAKEAMVSVRLAHPVCRVVHPASLINRETRIRAERESAPGLWARRHLADYAVGRDASLNPSDE